MMSSVRLYIKKKDSSNPNLKMVSILRCRTCLRRFGCMAGTGLEQTVRNECKDAHDQ